jgi:hypothetical protein
MSSKKCIVSFADGVGNYAKAMMRLELSLKQVGYGGEYERVKLINDYAHIESPFHKGTPDAVPYAFKAYSIKKAIDEGMRYILWLDSVVYATKSLTPVFNHIQEHGYLLLDNIGYSIGDYSSDACLSKFHMTREEAFNSPMIMACVMGFDVQNIVANNFLKWYIDAASDGVSYLGDWTNQNLQVSQDMRVKGHRHDQSVASIFAKQLGMTITNAQSTYFAYTEHKGKIPISPTVGLWSEGIL